MRSDKWVNGYSNRVVICVIKLKEREREILKKNSHDIYFSVRKQKKYKSTIQFQFLRIFSKTK